MDQLLLLQVDEDEPPPLLCRLLLAYPLAGVVWCKTATPPCGDSPSTPTRPPLVALLPFRHSWNQIHGRSDKRI